MNTITINTQNTLADSVFNSIKEDIIIGKIAQGIKMGEANLAKSYHVSRGPLREALQRLENINLIKRTPHSGSRVVILYQDLMRDIYQMREATEGLAARLSAQVMSNDEINGLYCLLDKHEEQIDKSGGQTYFQQEGDLDFHYYIFSKCQNPWLINYLENKLYHMLRMCRYRTSNLSFRTSSAFNQHRQIAEAIANRDAEFAEILMRKHISGAWQAIKKMLEDDVDKNQGARK